MLLAIAAALLAPDAGQPAAASPQSAQRPADPAALAEAIRYLDGEEFDSEVLRSAEMNLELQMQTTFDEIRKRSDEDVPEDLLEQLRSLTQEHVRTTLQTEMASIKRQAALIYAAHFTAAELVRLREISADPVMIKARKQNKSIEPQLIALGVRVMEPYEEDLQAKILRLVTDYFTAKQSGENKS
jgi:hypothetical protein